ncbi:MAG: DnaJ domain-containing protein [Lachnospiraceae bacterium]|nr:DnaJ domain-containing protein [Lachnospiraceae bacterium]
MVTSYAQACAVLGVEAGAEPETVKSAYRRLAKQLHPDAHPNQSESIREAYLLVTEAYDYMLSHKEEAVEFPAVRVMGSPIGNRTSTAERTADRRRFDEKYKERRAAYKQKLTEELNERKADMDRKRHEKELLNEIRMIRLAAAISAALKQEAEVQDVG